MLQNICYGVNGPLATLHVAKAYLGVQENALECDALVSPAKINPVSEMPASPVSSSIQ